MNETVGKMVEIAFRDVEMTPEVQELYEQVMADSQERFADQVASGKSEDEAIATVVESLLGMEEILGEYPAKKTEAEEERPVPDPNVTAVKDTEVDVTGIGKLIVELQEASITLTPSPDDRVHMHTEAEDIVVETRADTLVVRQLPKDRSLYWEGSGLLLSIFGRLSVSVEIHRVVELSVPTSWWPKAKIGTMSGDIRVHGVHFAGLSADTKAGDAEILSYDANGEAVCIATASGDITVENFHSVGELQMQSRSGDIRMTGTADLIKAESTSGDVEVRGQAHEMLLSTISADVEVNADTSRLKANTVSGDVTLNLTEASALEDIHAKAVSGDISVVLPVHCDACVQMQSMSGDTICRVPRREGLPQVHVALQSTSGDILVR
ncbi:MAG: DUF4097 family beta strand repeat protein [Clostridia bacterium]|nr:DUF4097 family beta strand repeat protein [Clostridia bacterium]MBR1685140.1 DUF4097 family beta strand repeat protein [Clostridia bacterium]